MELRGGTWVDIFDVYTSKYMCFMHGLSGGGAVMCGICAVDKTFENLRLSPGNATATIWVPRFYVHKNIVSGVWFNRKLHRYIIPL